MTVTFFFITIIIRSSTLDEADKVYGYFLSLGQLWHKAKSVEHPVRIDVVIARARQAC